MAPGPDPVAVSHIGIQLRLLVYVLSMAVHPITAELSSCDSDLMAHRAENIYYLVYRKHLPTSLVKGQ